MVTKLKLLIEPLLPKEKDLILKELLNIKNEKAIYHLKENEIYVYTYNNGNKLTIYKFVDNEKLEQKRKKDIKIINISTKLSYEQYKNNKYNNLTLLACFLTAQTKEEEIDIIKKMKISKKRKILKILKQNNSNLS